MCDSEGRTLSNIVIAGDQSQVISSSLTFYGQLIYIRRRISGKGEMVLVVEDLLEQCSTP